MCFQKKSVYGELFIRCQHSTIFLFQFLFLGKMANKILFSLAAAGNSDDVRTPIAHVQRDLKKKKNAKTI